MGVEAVKHSEILAYAELHEMTAQERWHLYRVVVAMDDVLVKWHSEKKPDGGG